MTSDLLGKFYIVKNAIWTTNKVTVMSIKPRMVVFLYRRFTPKQLAKLMVGIHSMVQNRRLDVERDTSLLHQLPIPSMVLNYLDFNVNYDGYNSQP